MSDFEPKTAVITGGASGIGFELAKQLSKRGLRVMIADLPGKILEGCCCRDRRSIGACLPTYRISPR